MVAPVHLVLVHLIEYHARDEVLNQPPALGVRVCHRKQVFGSSSGLDFAAGFRDREFKDSWCACFISSLLLHSMLLACVTGHSAGLLDASLNDIPPATSLHALTTAAAISEVRYAQEFTLLES